VEYIFHIVYLQEIYITPPSITVIPILDGVNLILLSSGTVQELSTFFDIKRVFEM
jgi:hypothetical protein